MSSLEKQYRDLRRTLRRAQPAQQEEIARQMVELMKRMTPKQYAALIIGGEKV